VSEGGGRKWSERRGEWGKEGDCGVGMVVRTGWEGVG